MFGFERYQWLDSCTGLELHILSDGEIDGRLCEITLKKNSLSIDSKTELKADLAAIAKKVPANKPLAISLTGKGVLIKKTTREDNLTDDRLLQIFPNIKPEQFYIQNFISVDSSFISIVRKEVVENILSVLNNAGKNILLINLGPFAAAHILKQVNFYGHDIRFNGHHITLSEGLVWDSYKYHASATAEFPLKIGIEPIGEQYLLAYATAFQLAFYEKLNAVELPVEAVQNTLDDFRQKQTFNLRLGLILGVFFVLLLINFVLFSFYETENSKLLAVVNQSTASVETLQQTQNQIQKNEKLIKDLGWYKGIRHAWLADQLGQSLPPGISLKEIAINPLNTTETNRQRREVYKPGLIEIVGETTALEPVNEWIYQLQKKTWPQRVNLDSFSPSTENNKQNFVITINY